MKRKFKIALSAILFIYIFIGSDISLDYVNAAEAHDYSELWSFGNAKICVDSEVYCCAFSGTTGYGSIVYPYGSSFTISCNYSIFASCAAGGKFYYFTHFANEISDGNVVIYDANTGIKDILVMKNMNVNSNELVAADIYGNIYFVNSDTPGLVKCFSGSGIFVCEISLSGSVIKLVNAGSGNVLAVCTSGNYLINSSGGCYYVGGSDVFPSGNGYFSDTYGGVYNSSVSCVHSGSGMSVCSSNGYVVYNSDSLICLDFSGKAYARADCVDGISRIYAIGDTIITFNGGGVFNIYDTSDFYKIQEETTAPTTQIGTEDVTRQTEEESDTTEIADETQTEATDEESFVVSSVYTLDDMLKYIFGVLPSTNEKEFIGNFSLQNTEYILQRGNDTNSYIANGDVVSFISNGNTETYRIVVNRDFNCDGKFNGDDIDAMAYSLLNGGSIHEWQSMCVDINDNGNIDLSDLYDCYLNS